MPTQYNDSEFGSSSSLPRNLSSTLHEINKDTKESPQSFVSISDLLLRCADDDVDRRLIQIMNQVDEGFIFRLDRYGRIKRTDSAPVLLALEHLWDWKIGEWSPPVDSVTFETLWDPYDELQSVGWSEELLPKSITSLECKTSEHRISHEKMAETKVKQTYLKAINSLLKHMNIDLNDCTEVKLAELFGNVSNTTAGSIRKALKNL